MDTWIDATSFKYTTFPMRLIHYFEQQYLPGRFLAQNTIYSYSLACREIDIDVEEISPKAVAQYGKRLIGKGLAPHTAKARCEIICCLWRHAAARSAGPQFDRPQTPRCPKKIVVATPPEKVAALIDHCLHLPGKLRRKPIPRSTCWAAFAAASYETALRTSDLRQLRWQPSGKWFLIQVKTGKPVTVDVGDRTLRLMEQLARVSPSLFELGWNREWYGRGLRRVASHIGLDVCPQQLRQSAASEAERLKPGSAWILLGHSSPATTQRWYIDSAHAYSDLPRPRIQWGDDPKKGPNP